MSFFQNNFQFTTAETAAFAKELSSDPFDDDISLASASDDSEILDNSHIHKSFRDLSQKIIDQGNAPINLPARNRVTRDAVQQSDIDDEDSSSWKKTTTTTTMHSSSSAVHVTPHHNKAGVFTTPSTTSYDDQSHVLKVRHSTTADAVTPHAAHVGPSSSSDQPPYNDGRVVQSTGRHLNMHQQQQQQQQRSSSSSSSSSVHSDEVLRRSNASLMEEVSQQREQQIHT